MAVLAIVCVAPAPPAATMQWAGLWGPTMNFCARGARTAPHAPGAGCAGGGLDGPTHIVGKSV